ncbi:hypothetical protein D3C87_1576560 [compost metagenome]
MARASLIEQNNAVELRIKVTTMIRRHSTAGTAVKEHNGLSLRVSALFPVKGVDVRNFQHALIRGLNFRVEFRHKKTS